VERHQSEITMIGRLLVVLSLLAPLGAWAQMPPQNLTATDGDEEVSLTWEEPTLEEDSLLCYRVYRATTSIDGNPDDHIEDRIAELDASGGGSPAYTDTDVINGTQYFYRVTAETGEAEEGTLSCGGPEAEESAFSNEAMATPGPVTLQITQPAVPVSQPVEAGDAVEVTVQGTNVPPDEAVQLRYRQGGETSFTDVPMNQEGGEFVASIPGTAVTAKGVEFIVTTRNNQGDEVRKPADGIASIRVETDALSVTQPGGTAPLAYRMVSFPTQLNDPQLSNLFEPLGSYDPTKWRLFEIDGGGATSSEDIYVERDDLSATLQTGDGIWLISQSEATLGPVRGTSVRTDQPYEIPLQEGWNLIGNPFAFDVPTSQLRVENSAGTLKEVYGFEGEFEMDVSVLEPYRGYLVRLSGGQAGTLVIDPAPSGSEASSPSTASAQTTWQVEVSAQVDQARDGHNTMGVAPGASTQVDPVDRREPPPIGNFVSLAFRPPGQYGELGRDIRGTTPSLHTWTAEVQTNVSGMVTITTSGIPSVPQDQEAWLVDPVLDVTRNLRKTSRYQFPALGEEATRRLQFLVGAPAVVQQTLRRENTRPQRVELLPSVPNPIRTHATLRYQLPEPMRVTLEVYDLLGRRVTTLVDGRQVEAGTHAYSWTPGAAGEGVSSGTYLLRLRAGETTRTRRLVVVR
jgi:hypothetical protein